MARTNSPASKPAQPPKADPAPEVAPKDTYLATGNAAGLKEGQLFSANADHPMVLAGLAVKVERAADLTEAPAGVELALGETGEVSAGE